ncbi:MAG: multidrug efflux RND transporter permease subunit [Thermoanaerobaculia bacterium]
MGGFSRFFIYRPIFAMVISIVIVIIGLLSIPILPVESVPNITPPTVKVSTSFPGASAEVLAETVAQPIEQEVNGVENMLYMSSKSPSTGDMQLTVTFAVGTDPDMAQVLTQNRVSIADPKLPAEVKQQGVVTKKQSTALVMVAALYSPDGKRDELYLSNYATTQVKDVLARVNGVGEVLMFGAKDYGMRIWLDPELLKARNLTTNEVLSALQEQNVQVAAGKIGEEPNSGGLNFEYTLTTLGRLAEVSQFEQIIIKRGEQGQLVRIADVARVELGAQSYAWYSELDAAPAISMGIYQLPGSNALAVAQGVTSALEELSTRFPESLEFSIPFDATRYIEASIKEVVTSLVIAVILVIFSVYIFLQDFRTTLVPAVTIPVALIGTFGVLLVTGQSINNLTLFGLVLAIGIVVDDAIVVVENTMRLIESEGLPPKEAVAKAMDEVGGAIVATTLVLLAVFAPTLVMPGLTGRMYRPFAITISVATIFSSINALTLSPALCGMLLRPSSGKKKGWFFTRFDKYFDRTASSYGRAVAVLVRRSLIVMIVFAGLVVAMVLGFGRMPGGFVPSEDEGYFFVNVQLPNAASLRRTREVMDRAMAEVEKLPGVQNIITIGGYTLLDAVQGPNYGAAIVSLVPWDEREHTVFELIQMVSQGLSKIREGTAFAFGPPPIQGLGSGSGFQMELQDLGGMGLRQLETFANDIVAAGFEGGKITRLNQNFQSNVPQIYIDVDREKTKRLQIPLQTVFDTLQANLGSAYVNDFNLFGRTWRVMVQADEEFRSRVSDIQRLEVRTDEGRMVPLSTLVSVYETVGPSVVNRFNMFPSATITGAPAPGYSEGESVDEIERITQQTIPSQMGFSWSGVTQQQKESGDVAPLIFSLALIMVFLFLAAQYESWATPLAVLLSVPLAILGAIIFTLIRGFDNNIYTQIGFVLLIGMSAKNAILIVEFAKQQRDEAGKSVIEAAREAARLRFRPILMTALSFLLGVIPLVIASGAGANSRVSLGTAVFGGMLLATVAGVFMIPLLYVVVQLAAEKLGGGKSTPAPAIPEPEPPPTGP